ncbi:MAG TPA: TolC family protein [Bryobacteraceae bacterium]|nr:TolC family protein [Bryobacteraceae bacterium]
MRFFVRGYVFPLMCAPALFGQASLTLGDAVARALKGNPLLSVASAHISAAEGLRKQAGLSPNPRLFVQLENTRFWENPSFSYPKDTATYAFLAQTVETGGKRNRRVALATEEIRSSELEMRLQRNQIESRVSVAYWAAAGAARARDLLQEEVASFERVVQFHRDRVREGAAPEVDLVRIEVERDRLASLARTASKDAELGRIALFREMGESEFPQVAFSDVLEQVIQVGSFSPDQVLERRVEMALARQAVEQARANLRLQQAHSKPDPDLQFGYERIGGFDTLYAAAQVPLPIRNRNQGQIEAAAAELKAAESSVAATKVAIRSELESSIHDYESRQKLINETLRPMLDRANEVYRIVDAAYRETGSDILRLLDAERTKIEAELMYVRALSDLQQSAVVLETAQGALP